MAEHELNKIVDDDGEVFNLRDSTKQPTADRVTAWGSTPSDTKYPSEKLVKTSLDAKAPNAPSEVTIATGDKPLIADSSDGNKVKRASISFDTGVANTFLRRNGTFGKVLYADEGWGGAFRTSLSPFDNYAFKNANCFFGPKPSAIRVEYTNDGGTTWNDYGLTDTQKVDLFSQYGSTAVSCGKSLHVHPGYTPSTTATKDLSNDNIADQRLRITICDSSLANEGTTNSTDRWMYCTLRRIGIYMSTQSAGGGSHCLFERRTSANFKSGTDTWVTVGDYKIQGDSGWNSIPCLNDSSENGISFGSSDTQSREVRFTIWSDQLSATPHPSQTGCMRIFKVVAYSENLWTNNSANPNIGNYSSPYTVNPSTGVAHFSKGITSGVAIPVGSGGTGKTSVTAGNYLVGNGTSALTEKTPNTAANDLINALSTGDAPPTGEDYYVAQFAGGGTTTKTYHRRPIKALWEYIKAQISSVLGLTATSYGGNAATATALASGSADRTKLDGIAAGAEVNVQSDWNQATTTADDYIKNKPTLGTAAAKNVPTSGNASTSQVVMGNDSRLTDARLTTGPKYYDLYNSGTSMYGWHIGTSNVPNASNDGFFKAVICISRWTQSNTDSKPEECFGYLDITHRNSSGSEEYYARIYAIGGVTTASNMGWCVMAIRGDSSKKIEWYVVRNPDNEAASGEVGINWGALSVIPMVNTSSSFTLDTSLAHMTSKWTTYLNYYATKRAPYLTASQVGVGSNSEPVYVDNGQIKKCTGVQPSLSTQTAYTSKGSATKVPQITTNSLGQVTGINEVTISGVTPASHASSSDTYGLGTTSNYGHVKLATGDMNGASNADGVACSKNHTHSQYLTSHQDISGKMATSASNATSEAGGNIIRSLSAGTNIGAGEYIAAAGASSGQWRYTFSTLLDWINSKNVIERSPADVGTSHKRIQLGYGGYTNDNVGYCCYLVHIFFNYVADNLVGKGVTVLVNYDWRKTAYQSAKCQILNDNGLSAAGYNVVLANFKTDNNTNLHVTLGLVKNTAPTTLVGFSFSYCKIMRIAYGGDWTESVTSDNVDTYNYLIPAVFGKADSFSTSVNAGSANQPVYFNNGVPTVCNWWVS